MLNIDKTLKTKVLKTVVATIHLALISSGLVSCVIQAPNPPESNSPPKQELD
ncbi:hypothetical protein [Nostoc sp. FACHB-110]|uniref:hypothetical protein n=1 Tax=Nostoc sp. FACHB-110 TaxID=2692834 RepID=UPI0016862733|nr:hypothetical protein [Nostoc sp. FACHB-110]MBD2441472.1 hypothetical protein [Nostoc sp. FACHB-110]